MVVVSHDLPEAKPYLDHIEANGERMRMGLVDGTLGTRLVLCAR